MTRAPLERASAVASSGAGDTPALRMRLRVHGYDRARVRRGCENGVAIRRDRDRRGRNHVRHDFQLAGFRGSGAKEFIDGIRAVVGDIKISRAIERHSERLRQLDILARRPASRDAADNGWLSGRGTRDGADCGVAAVGNKDRAVGRYRDFAAHGELIQGKIEFRGSGRAAITYRANSAYSCYGSGEKPGGVSGRDVWCGGNDISKYLIRTIDGAQIQLSR